MHFIVVEPTCPKQEVPASTALPCHCASLGADAAAKLLVASHVQACSYGRRAAPNRTSQGRTCVLGAQEAAHLIHLPEALPLIQRQISRRCEAPFLQNNHLQPTQQYAHPCNLRCCHDKATLNLRATGTAEVEVVDLDYHVIEYLGDVLSVMASKGMMQSPGGVLNFSGVGTS